MGHYLRKETGIKGEKAAAAYLEKNGYHILHRNFRVKRGEIQDVLSEWEKEAGIRNRTVKVVNENGEFTGTIQGIDRISGALRLAQRGAVIEIYEGSLQYLD